LPKKGGRVRGFAKRREVELTPDSKY